jgi:hypothetical protein
MDEEMMNEQKISDPSIRKTYFGIAALIVGILSVLSLLANYGAVYLNISYKLFNSLNNLTALLYCVLTQVSFVLGLIGLTRKNDSKNLSLAGITLVVIAFLIMFAQFVYSFIK